LTLKPKQRKEKAMIARFDHRPMLTAALALATTVLVVVVVTLSMLLITSPQATSPPSIGGANPGAVSNAGGSEVVAAPEISPEHHAEVVAANNK